MSDRFESEEMPSLLEMTGFYQMAYLFVLWLGEKAAEKVFTSLRLILWSIVLNRLFPLSKNRFLIMMDRGEHHSFLDLLRQLNLMIEEEQHFLQMLTDDQRESIGDLLKASKSISSDAEHRLMVNIEHVDDDYLLKSSKETSIRLPEDPRLYDKLYTFGQCLQQDEESIHVIHLCDFQSQYQCELFAVLSTVVYPEYADLQQKFLTLAPAVLNDDRPTTKYDEHAVHHYIQEVLAKIVNERTVSSSSLPLSIFKLQLICRKQNAIVHLRPNLETNHDALFLLYTGARLSSIITSYEEKHQTGIYPAREWFHDELATILTTKDEREFLKWIESFESRFLLIAIDPSNKLQLPLDKIFQEWILFARRLSPYYSKVRILTENQGHLLRTMFARLELIERILKLLRRTFALIGLPLIERM